MKARSASETSLVLSAVLAIAVDLGLARLGYGLTLPAIRKELPGSFGAYGAVATWHFVGYLLGSLAAPFVLRRDPGGRRSAVGSHLAVAALLFASAAAQSLVELGALRALLGVASGLGIASVVTGTLERVDATRRSMVSGRVWAGFGAGLMLSALAAPALLGQPSYWRAGTIVAGVLGLVCAVCLARTFAASLPPRTAASAREAPFNLSDLLKPQRYLLFVAAYFSFGVSYTAFATFFVAAMRNAQATSMTIGAVWACFGFAASAGGLFVGRLMAMRNDALAIVLASGAVGAAIASIAFPFASVAGAIAVGAGVAATPAIASALARARSSAETGAAAFVAVTAIFGIGQIVGPAVAGLLADHAGPSTVTLFAASTYTIGAIVAFADARIVKPR